MRTSVKNITTVIGFSLAAMMSIPAAQAIEGGVDVGKNFTDVNIGMGQHSSGLYINGGWVKNNENGREVAGAETGINLPAGPALVNLGIQANYIKGSNGSSEGVVFPVGAGVQLPVSDSVGLYASAYTAPRQLSNSTKNYLDVDSGLSWKPVQPLTLKAGYRYIGMDGKNQRPNERLVEGPYVGGQVSF
ncbi:MULTISPECIES: YfaZ family outer membrane protein [unclassified Brenneria]|uniref:YfaZ family outer membrane protein n=1 Tax=unclassified Brenneria TaxID=2634434 RepID=UPI0018F0F1CC|nr:YfaZ family outer membrane protein [Brenneria sp. L3-3C-1]MBJ7221523.1 porin [Brenneria sp. L3-3C-1]MEE3642765.1 YfaZ family outer membrane protein [Brenneria sp. L3_3C_1]